MDLPTTFSLVAVAVSALALVISTTLAVLQVRIMKRGNYVSLVTDHIKEFRSPGFYDDLVYVTTRLKDEHDPSLGVSGLPPEARMAVLNVAYFYQQFAWFIELDVLRREPAVELIAQRIRLVWEAIAPYLKAERSAIPGPFFELLQRVYNGLADHSSGQQQRVSRRLRPGARGPGRGAMRRAGRATQVVRPGQRRDGQ
jgi:hypothetical protein